MTFSHKHGWSDRLRIGLCLFVLCLGLSSNAAAQNDVVGRWSRVPDLPFVPAHSHVLPTGKVMIWGTFDLGTEARLWDPATATLSPLTTPYNVFCSGHSFLANGNLFVAGGDLETDVGRPDASMYDPFTAQWSSAPNMNAGRWYPTATTLANGDVLVTSGSMDTLAGENLLPEVFQVGSGTWRDLTDAQITLDLYPRMHLAPNGRVFNSAPSTITRYLDTSGTGAWTVVANHSVNVYRDYGSSVMYDNGKVLVVGGGNPPTNTAEVIDLNASSPAWRQVASMAFARRQHNATLLPDGKVLVTGGTSGPGFANNSTPVFVAEMWDPATENWATMASQDFRRIYHSMAVLLPDGRVLTGGGDTILAAEVYEPPYLFKGARPTISSAPASMNYGQTFLVETPNAASVTQVTWIRLSSVTHANNMEQRFSRLSFSQVAGGLNVVAPSNPNLAPPGYYMLFILNSNGVPSVAKIIQISSTGAPAPGSLQFSAATFTVAENVTGGNATITITRTGGSAGAVGVTFTTSNGTATAPGDYTAVTQTVTFANGDTANKTVPIPIVNDTLVEPNETINLALTSPTGGATLGSPNTAVLTITDNDGGTTLSASPTTVAPGGTITATWSGIANPSTTDWIGLYTPGAGNTAFIDWIYVSCSKSPGSPRASGSCSFVVPTSVAPGTYQLRLLANNGFTTLLATSNNFTVGAGGGAGSLQFSAATFTVAENVTGGNATITITRTGGSAGAVGVTFTTSNGTATAPGDYTAVTQTVTFANGDTANKTVPIPIVNDTLVEPNETINLALTSPTGGATLGSPNTAVLTITDNDGGTTLSASPTTVAPGGTITATWSGIANPSTTDWIGLYTPGAGNTAFIDWIYVSCSKSPGSPRASGSCSFVVPTSVAPGTYQLRLLANNGFTLLTTSNNFTVAPPAGATLSASPTTVARGGTVTATWSGISTPSATDWIGLYAPGAANTAFIDWIYVSCSKTAGAPRASGSCSFVVPTNVAPGNYQLRLLANDGFTVVLATSNNFTVQ